jgi:hypothetical protein
MKLGNSNAKGDDCQPGFLDLPLHRSRCQAIHRPAAMPAGCVIFHLSLEM